MPEILDYCKGRKVDSFAPGAVLIDEGAQEGKLFVLVEGQVEVMRKHTQVSYIDEPGSLFGEMSVLLDMPSTATVKALTVRVGLSIALIGLLLILDALGIISPHG